MTADLEVRLRDVFAREVASMPISRGVDDVGADTDVSQVLLVPMRTESTRRRATRVALGAVAAASIVALTAVAVRPSDSADDPVQASTFVPDGAEVPMPLVDAAPPADHVIKPGSLVSMTVDGQLFQQFVTAMQYAGEVRQMSCQFERGGSGGCTPFDDAVPQTISRTSSVDNGVHGTNFWMWTGVPSDVVFVQFHEGDLVMWQRPVAGVASFPIADNGASPFAVGFDATGVQVARIDRDTPSTVRPPDLARQALWDALPQDVKDTGWRVVNDVLGPCVDAGEVWEGCVALADQQYLAWLQERTNLSE
jgi:hypothetical protein